jgi:Ca2+-binding EF-hand superfamily protein
MLQGEDIDVANSTLAGLYPEVCAEVHEAAHETDCQCTKNGSYWITASEFKQQIASWPLEQLEADYLVIRELFSSFVWWCMLAFWIGGLASCVQWTFCEMGTAAETNFARLKVVCWLFGAIGYQVHYYQLIGRHARARALASEGVVVEKKQQPTSAAPPGGMARVVSTRLSMTKLVAMQTQKREAPKNALELVEDPQALREIYARVDRNNDEQVNKRELILSLRHEPSLCKLLGLPAHIRQEGKDREDFEDLFHTGDKDDDRQLSYEEFVAVVVQLKQEHVRRKSLMASAPSAKHGVPLAHRHGGQAVNWQQLLQLFDLTGLCLWANCIWAFLFFGTVIIWPSVGAENSLLFFNVADWFSLAGIVGFIGIGLSTTQSDYLELEEYHAQLQQAFATQGGEEGWVEQLRAAVHAVDAVGLSKLQDCMHGSARFNISTARLRKIVIHSKGPQPICACTGLRSATGSHTVLPGEFAEYILAWKPVTGWDLHVHVLRTRMADKGFWLQVIALVGNLFLLGPDHFWRSSAQLSPRESIQVGVWLFWLCSLESVYQIVRAQTRQVYAKMEMRRQFQAQQQQEEESGQQHNDQAVIEKQATAEI